ncbi:MAG: FAD-dependent oxidoreductase [Lachnospiraceae bacterium]|nr:FAD-dependent oxidoreductase [Lachnospiraceae bacterium]
MKVKYLVLGAGPAGLTFANRLRELGADDYIVLEQDSEAGGLCRSRVIDGAPLDIGGGHFLDTKRKNVLRFLFEYMPESEWNVFERDSQIDLNGQFVSHPLEANIWQLDKKSQVEYLKSIAVSGANIGIEKPEKFIEWIYWKLGDKIANEYMIPYNEKIFGSELNELGTYWLDKLPTVSFEETLLSCLDKKSYGTQPGHSTFYYPKKYGYGEVWRRLADNLGEKLVLNSKVRVIDLDKRQAETGKGEKYEADYIICTIPWKSVEIVGSISNEMTDLIKELKHTSIVVEYHNEKIETDAHWIYIPDKNKCYHRILVRSNFALRSRGYWTETNLSRVNHDIDNNSFLSEYAYPLNTIGKPVIMMRLLEAMRDKNIFGLGRWGEHQHFNSDVVVEKAIGLAERIFNL